MIKVTKALIEQLRKNTIATLKNLSEDDIANIIQKANYSYYNTETPLFSDKLYDVIRDYLEDINPNHPILKNIGIIGNGDKKETLPYFMGSLDKIKADEKAIEKFKKEYPNEYVVSDKLDGNSALLYYKNGITKLYTRGDGTTGQNISHLIPFIKNIKNIKMDIKSEVTLRGELIISKVDFEGVKDKGANARNMVAGVLNSKIPDLELVKIVQFVGYELINPVIKPDEQFKYMKDFGFKIVYNQKVEQKNLTVTNLSKILIDRRSKSEFEIDGIVVFHNSIHKRTKENPKYAFAFKSILTLDKAEVTVLNVEWNMSKDGYFIPVVNFNPVSLDGAVIRKAHGFNGKFIKDNKIGPGSKIVIIRSGAVIPYINEIVSESETGEGQMPETKYVWTKTGVDIMLAKDEHGESDELGFKNLEYFFNKIDVEGLSSGNLKKIYDSGKKTVRDILNISVKDLLKVEGFKEKMAVKIFTAINESKKTLDCVKVMSASNTLGRGFGVRKIELITENIPSILTERYIPTHAELLAIKGIEKITADAFIKNLPDYFKFVDENNIQCLLDVNEKKDITKNNDVVVKGKKFDEMKFVFTGFRDEKLEKYIKANGGTVSTSVSKLTTAVIRKDGTDESSGKIKKAQELNVRIINLQDFINQNKIVL